MTEIVTNVVTSGAISTVLGFLAGFAAKKVLKIVAVVVGGVILLLVALDYYRLIDARWDNIKSTATNATHFIYAQSLGVEHHLAGTLDSGTQMVLGIGFVGGFLLGFRKG
jgi:uncharacterized membrane protein (Fun14 family)